MRHSFPRYFSVPAAFVAVMLLAASCSSNPSASKKTSTTKAPIGATAPVSTATTQAATTSTSAQATPTSSTTTTAPATATTHVTSPPPTTPSPTVPKVTTPPGRCSAGFVCGHVTAIGDSVMLDVEPSLQSDIPGIDVDAEVSRQWDDGVEVVQQMKEGGTLGSTVVIDLGTNGPVSLQMFEQMMSALAGASVVVFVTVHLPPSYSWSQSVNETLEQGVTMYPEDRLADFNKYADVNPEWFGSDGVHMPIGGTGAQLMAHLIASTI
jgi:hypothetical protein